MHRFLVDAGTVPGTDAQGANIVFPEVAARQIRTVLRMQRGDRVIALTPGGWEMEVELTQVGRDGVAGKVLSRRAAGGEPGARITLYQSLLKRDNFEWVLQKCTEIGVAVFVPVVSRRTVIRSVDDVKESRLGRWRRIIAEAVEQSRRGRVPALHEPLRFEEAVAQAAQSGLCLIPWEEEASLGLRAALAAVQRSGDEPAAVSLFIGPEGGFDPEEIVLARECGAIPVTLGPRILRAETAAVVVASLVLYELGDLG